MQHNLINVFQYRFFYYQNLSKKVKVSYFDWYHIKIALFKLTLYFSFLSIKYPFKRFYFTPIPNIPLDFPLRNSGTNFASLVKGRR